MKLEPVAGRSRAGFRIQIEQHSGIWSCLQCTTVFFVFTCDRSQLSPLLSFKFFVPPKLHLPFGNLNTIIMLRGLEIKRLSQLLKNKQKQDEMQTRGWLTSKEVHTFHATLVELCYFYKSRDELVSSDFHFQFITV